MPDDATVRLPPLAGRQQESWLAFIELAPTLGDHCLLIGGSLAKQFTAGSPPRSGANRSSQG